MAVREALGKAGIEYSRCCGHSFRIGAATTAASRSYETLGQLTRLAYLGGYVLILRKQLASYSSMLC